MEGGIEGYRGTWEKVGDGAGALCSAWLWCGHYKLSCSYIGSVSKGMSAKGKTRKNSSWPPF